MGNYIKAGLSTIGLFVALAVIVHLSTITQEFLFKIFSLQHLMTISGVALVYLFFLMIFED